MKTSLFQLLSCYTFHTHARTHTRMHTTVTLGASCFLKHSPLSCLRPYPNCNKAGFDGSDKNVINIWIELGKGIAHSFHTFLLWPLGSRQCKWHFLHSRGALAPGHPGRALRCQREHRVRPSRPQGLLCGCMSFTMQQELQLPHYFALSLLQETVDEKWHLWKWPF